MASIPVNKKKKRPVPVKGTANKITGASKASFPAAKKVDEKTFPIVGIGASSGGLEAVTELLKFLPANTGMGFIFIQHLSPDYKSILTSLLAKATKMKVQEVEGKMRIEPNNVYVIPHDKGIEVTDGHVQLIPREKNNSPNLSIDVLFTSLAETHKENAIGVVLSGNASDGTMGLKAIKQEGGITFAQDNSAKYSGMPESAIGEGVADFVLSPRDIALQLSNISKHALTKKDILKVGSENSIADNDPTLKTILGLLNKETGVDFNYYKLGTIKRRILRRMFLYRLNTLAQYLKLMQAKSEEAGLLFGDLLINVTDFFRDKETFQYLKTTLLPGLLKARAEGEPLRIWVAACSSGQEAYSIAMLLIELIGAGFSGKQVQIFASDLSEAAIKKARKGEYTKYEVRAISPKRLARFFTQVGANYRVTKSVRDLCVFAPHNILSDPPFSRIDFISCCNLLIYLDTAMHKKVLTTFHYALNDGGCLMLSKSETIDSTQLFLQFNKDFKIFTRKKSVRSLPNLVLSQRTPFAAKAEAEVPPKEKDFNAVTMDSAVNSILFSRFIPAYVVINQAREILQFKGATSNYLEHGTGKASLNIGNMARPEIAFELRDAINKAIETNREIRRPGIELKNGAVSSVVSLNVIPLSKEGEEALFLIVFSEQELAAVDYNQFRGGKNNPTIQQAGLKKLKEELVAVRAELIAISEEKETANKKVQEVQEEILSSNEEFRSMNEEMETSKEEIESANQELIITNQQLQTRNEQLAEANDFSEAIVATLHEPMLILDKDLRVKLSNQAFYKKFRVNQAEVDGRLLYELGNKQWDIPGLRELLENIIQRDTYFYEYEITLVFPDIGKKTMLLNAMRIVQQIENEQLILLAFTDTTERSLERKVEKEGLEDIINARTRALEESHTALKEQNVSLEKMNKELETFTFISSHDLQEPLRKIKNFGACLLKEEEKQLSTQGKDYLERMEEAVTRMQRLIDDLLIYSRVKNSRQSFELSDLNKIAAEVIADFDDTVKEKKATITVGDLCKVNVNRPQFRQLMNNLVNNALKFSDAQRAPVITIKSETALGDSLNNDDLSPAVKYCHMTVTDNGIGFDPKYKDRIFEIFQRLNDYDDYKGTGIGLALCKRIAENHKGFITASGVLKKGARVDVYVPTE